MTVEEKKALKSEMVLAELEQIAKSHKGMLQPRDVVEFARNKTTALHSHFEWDNGHAAEQWRLWQARQLISVTVTILDVAQGPVRAFVSLKTDRKEGGYRTIGAVLSNRKFKAQMLQDALDDARHFRAKYDGLAKLSGVFKEIDKIVKPSGRRREASRGKQRSR